MKYLYISNMKEVVLWSNISSLNDLIKNIDLVSPTVMNINIFLTNYNRIKAKMVLFVFNKHPSISLLKKQASIATLRHFNHFNVSYLQHNNRNKWTFFELTLFILFLLVFFCIFNSFVFIFSFFFIKSILGSYLLFVGFELV